MVILRSSGARVFRPIDSLARRQNVTFSNLWVRVERRNPVIHLGTFDLKYKLCFCVHMNMSVVNKLSITEEIRQHQTATVSTLHVYKRSYDVSNSAKAFLGTRSPHHCGGHGGDGLLSHHPRPHRPPLKFAHISPPKWHAPHIKRE